MEDPFWLVLGIVMSRVRLKFIKPLVIAKANDRLSGKLPSSRGEIYVTD